MLCARKKESDVTAPRRADAPRRDSGHLLGPSKFFRSWSRTNDDVTVARSVGGTRRRANLAAQVASRGARPRAWRVGAMAPDESSRAAAAREAARDAHRSLREPAKPDAATRVAEAARAAEPLLDMKQRTTRDDPDGFMETFFRASRLHYIGTWKHRYEAFLEDLPGKRVFFVTIPNGTGMVQAEVVPISEILKCAEASGMVKKLAEGGVNYHPLLGSVVSQGRAVQTPLPGSQAVWWGRRKR